ncbi:MAG: hypothetical protein JWP52_654, partial [Rhizobacter sp.]|nr:hypothetical protein [Rhizobacter sp.]
MANVSNPKGHNFGFHGTGLILNGDPLKTHAGQGSIGAAH